MKLITKRKVKTAKKTVAVKFAITADAGAEVYVTGTFNDWKADACRLTATNDDTVYAGVISVPPGEHEYKFVVNGQWMADPNNQEWRPNGIGSINSVLRA